MPSLLKSPVYAALAGFLGQRGLSLTSAAASQRWHSAILAVRWEEWSYNALLTQLLTPEQGAIVFSDRNPAVSRLLLMTRKEAERYLAQWFLGPA